MSEISRMSNLYTDIIESIETNLFEFSLLFGKTLQGAFYDGPDVKWAYTGTNTVNRVLGLNVPEDSVDVKISEIVEMFRVWNSPFTWITGPSTIPSDVSLHLIKGGFVPDQKWTGMALELDKPAEKPVLRKGLKIIKVLGNDEFYKWDKVRNLGFGRPEYLHDDYRIAFENLYLDRYPSLQHYLGYFDGHPAASCTLYLGKDSTAGLYFIATLPEYRGQGIASALILNALHDARLNGYKRAVLHASPMGEPVYEKLGFIKHCTLDRYNWVP